MIHWRSTRLMLHLACAIAPCLAAPPAMGQQLAVAPPPSAADTGVLQRPVTIQLKNVPVYDAVIAVGNAAGVRLVYEKEKLDATAHRVTIHVTKMPLGQAFELVLNGTRLTAIPVQNDVVSIESARTMAERTADSASVTGRVTEEGTGKPLANAQVSVAGTNIHAITNSSGAFLLRNVPAGKITLSVRLLGYRMRSSAATVPESGSVTQNLVLERQAAVLNDVITTATGGQRRVEVANTVVRLNVDSLIANAPIRSVTDLIGTRVPGVQVTRASGAPGAPSRIRIAGISSTTLSNDPIVILDGIRISGPATTADGTTRQLSSPLDDVDPQSLESVEIVYGPAAAALYGTDAANGVIILKSKRGIAGKTRWSVNATHDWTSVPTKYPPKYQGWGTSVYSGVPGWCNVASVASGSCTFDSLATFNPKNSSFTTDQGRGSNTQYSVSLSGGSQQATYAITASQGKAVGASKLSNVDAVRARLVELPVGSDFLHPLANDRSSLSGALTLMPYAHLNLSAIVMATRGTARSNQLTSRISSSSAYDDTLTFTPGSFNRSGSREISNNGTGGITATLDQLMHWLTITGTVGLQRVSTARTGTGASYNCVLIGGCVMDSSSNNMNLGNNTTETYSSRLTVLSTNTIGPALRMSTSFQFDYNRSNVNATGIIATMLAPGSTDIATAKTQTAQTQLTRSATVGVSLNETVSLAERLFLQLGFRRDAGSAFGKDLQMPVYPKIGISWLISEEPFFPTFGGVLTSLQLRTAYGQSGVQPGRNDAPPTFNKVFAVVNGQAVQGITYSSIGNSLLSPERSAEWEGGFMAVLFDNRLNIDLAGHSKRSQDQILRRTLPPSAPSTVAIQAQNLGSVVNRTLTLSVEGTIVDLHALQWTVGSGLTMTRNKVTSLAPATPFGTTSSRIAEGYPIAGSWAKPVLAVRDVNGDGVVDIASEVLFGDTTVFIGGTIPRYSMTYSSTLRMGRVSVSAEASYDGGYVMQRYDYNGRGLQDPHSSFAEQAYGEITRLSGDWQDVSVLRLQSITMNYQLPARLVAVMRANSAVLQFSGSNLGTWTRYRGADPTITSNLIGEARTDTGNSLPITRNWSMGLRLGF